MEMELVLIAGLLIGVVGTGLGGVAIVLLGRPGEKFLSGALGFAGGIMLTVIFVSLIPEAIEIAGFLPAFIGIIAGILLILGMDTLIPQEYFSGTGSFNSHLIKTGVILGAGIALHNIPEGLAIGISYVANKNLGYTIALIMLIQNIPEGMAIAAPLYIGGTSKFKVIGITALAGVPMGIGVLIAYLFGNISPSIISIGLGFAAGAMLFIVFDEMIPSANDMFNGRPPAIGAIMGALLGVFIGTFGA
ncbi:MAG TPA: ZIP family metal transporter [Tepidimicrobium sp.]|nr:ZIP family metal transporter [Tepidimicrobium sp.]